MIELTQIKSSDQIKSLRGQLNTAFSEIVSDQPFVGQVINPSITFHSEDDAQVGAVTASNIAGHIFALCFPESNGVYIADVFGAIEFDYPALTATPAVMKIDVPTVKMPTRTANISTFVSPTHLGFTGFIVPEISNYLTGVSDTNTITTKNQLYVLTKNKTLSVADFAMIEEHDNTCNLIYLVSAPQ